MTSQSAYLDIFWFTQDEEVRYLLVVIDPPYVKKTKVENEFSVMKNWLRHVIFISSINFIWVMLSNFNRVMPLHKIRNCNWGSIVKLKTNHCFNLINNWWFVFSFTILPQLQFLIWCGGITLLKFYNITQKKLILEMIITCPSRFFITENSITTFVFLTYLGSMTNKRYRTSSSWVNLKISR